MTYGTCKKCGVEVKDWEAARVHARDKHGGITPDMMDMFEEEHR